MQFLEIDGVALDEVNMRLYVVDYAVHAAEPDALAGCSPSPELRFSGGVEESGLRFSWPRTPTTTLLTLAGFPTLGGRFQLYERLVR